MRDKFHAEKTCNLINNNISESIRGHNGTSKTVKLF